MEKQAASPETLADNETQLEFNDIVVSSAYLFLQLHSILAGDNWFSPHGGYKVSVLNYFKAESQLI